MIFVICSIQTNVIMACRCNNNACSTCECAKSNVFCTLECHGKRDWSDIPCLNNEFGKKAKSMKIKDVRTALCANGLSPVGDKSELLKRLADHFRMQQGTAVKNSSVGNNVENSSRSAMNANKELFNALIENDGDYEFVLSLSGKTVSKDSSKPELRRAYLLLSAKVHPDKNGGSKESIQAFQALLSAFEHLANPQQFLDDDDDDKPAKKRQKTERFTRSNGGCFKTKIKCPQCKQTWGGAELGLEDAAYNFFMLAIKTYICGLCSCEFGCMTGLHYCPQCNKEFEYDPDDYHRKITCGNKKCEKKFGFWMFKVPERREKEVRIEAKKRQEAEMKKISQRNRRAARAGKRKVKGDESSGQRLQEQLFIIGLKDVCPRCGWELERGEGTDEAKMHLEECDNKDEIKKYQKLLQAEKDKASVKGLREATQAEVMAVKQWEHNGRQVGQLWMLSENMLMKQCKEFKLSLDGSKHELISRLGDYLRKHERLMITDGKSKLRTEVSYDTVGVSHADEEDLPENIHRLEREELQDLCASYRVKFDPKKDVKSDLIRKFEAARTKGNSRLMICDKKESEPESESESDEEYQVNGEDEEY